MGHQAVNSHFRNTSPVFCLATLGLSGSALTSTTMTSTVIVDTVSPVWATDSLKGFWFVNATHAGTARILSNTADTITLESALASNADGDTYYITPALAFEHARFPHNWLGLQLFSDAIETPYTGTLNAGVVVWEPQLVNNPESWQSITGGTVAYGSLAIPVNYLGNTKQVRMRITTALGSAGTAPTHAKIIATSNAT